MSVTPGRVQSAAPTLGQHTVEVLRDVLGYEQARIQALLAAGAAVQGERG
jgi:formyl-CoA transferase